MSEFAFAPPVSKADIIAKASGVIGEPFPRALMTIGAGADPGDGTIHGVMVGLNAGDEVTALTCYAVTAGSGLTLVKMGLHDSSGVTLAETADFEGAGTIGSGWDNVPALISPYEVTETGAYFVSFIAVGTVPPLLATGGPLAAGANLVTNNHYNQRTGRTDMSDLDLANPETTALFYLAALGQ